MVTQTPGSELNTDMKSSFSKTVWKHFEEAERDQIPPSASVKNTQVEINHLLAFTTNVLSLLPNAKCWTAHFGMKHFISDFNIGGNHQN